MRPSRNLPPTIMHMTMNEIAFRSRMMEVQPNSLSPVLSLSEKEIARILGPQTFTGIPCELYSMETFGENYFSVLM